jgi:hypothetical protein
MQHGGLVPTHPESRSSRATGMPARVVPTPSIAAAPCKANRRVTRWPLSTTSICSPASLMWPTRPDCPLLEFLTGVLAGVCRVSWHASCPPRLETWFKGAAVVGHGSAIAYPGQRAAMVEEWSAEGTDDVETYPHIRPWGHAGRTVGHGIGSRV